MYPLLYRAMLARTVLS